jgi:hypothetical protein
MDFKTATDILFEHVGHSELANVLDVSVASIRQARLSDEAKAHRAPPASWRDGVRHIAERQVARLTNLLNELDRDSETVLELPAARLGGNMNDLRRHKPGSQAR